MKTYTLELSSKQVVALASLIFKILGLKEDCPDKEHYVSMSKALAPLVAEVILKGG